ncbi:MAG: hypothetical protein H6669_13580 [Ardenticatenaceae bacterium]|nr:hypothetical protein [Ardenticatenaceae bacterium]
MLRHLVILRSLELALLATATWLATDCSKYILFRQTVYTILLHIQHPTPLSQGDGHSNFRPVSGSDGLKRPLFSL